MAKAPNLMKKKQEPVRLGRNLRQDFIGHRQHARHRLGDHVPGYLNPAFIFNQWINEHDVGHPAGCNPILVLDVFEHAFITDYGLKRADLHSGPSSRTSSGTWWKKRLR